VHAGANNARWSPPVLAALLFALTLALYWRTGSFAFLNYDDDAYVTANDGVRGGLSAAGLRWALTTGHAANWHPLTWLSHQLDVELFGLDAGAHHRTSAALHALNAALCFIALRALTGATVRSWIVAALFAWHPLRVESVAWVAERKDLLAGCAAFACLWAYAAYARAGGWVRYGVCAACFALGLLAKPMLVTLPFVLLLLDVWPLGRTLGRGEGVQPERAPPVPLPSQTPTHPMGTARKSPFGRSRYEVFAEKIPLLALALVSALVTLAVQRAGGALGPLERVPFLERLANAFRSLAIYVARSFAPHDLAVFHPHPALSEPPEPSASLLAGVGVALVVGVTLLSWKARRRTPFVLVGWAWFVGMLVPVLGLVQVGLQGWAERYTYLPSVGLNLAVVWSAATLAQSTRARGGVLALALVVLGASAWTSVRYAASFRDSRTLFERALAADESPVAHVNLARALEEAGERESAEHHYARALELVPTLAGARVNRARLWRTSGRGAEALAELERAVHDEPELAPARAELGWMLAEAGRDREALLHLRRAVELASEVADYRHNLAWVLATSRECAAPEEALALAEALSARSAGQLSYQETRAAALARLGRFAEAARIQNELLPRIPERFRPPAAERARLYAEGKPFLRSP
jgi:tetratricopeptide (TPR) repeat protein